MHPDHQRDFTEFVASRSDSLIRLAYVLTNDQHAAEDLLQTALAKAAGHWRRIRGNPEAYMRRVMYHEQVGRWRSPRWGRERVLEALPDRGVEDRTSEVDTRVTLAEALRMLPARKRAVLVLRYYEDLSESEVAKIMGCSVGTVRSQTHQAVARLRELVGEAVILEGLQ
ncbi:RNA polymerase ECF-subfamily sigma factor [[Actinomadura] parvosata subsp. kistnae]|uniref:RNA polymerase subunit sigma n=1 Tax=[Actinomadura] parvosata subsp. kistnae TaxID=1909395 RepID=A0A1V0AB76_9ACTN|nr:SigE family RNA polymerase sigma factor [Nonomuraea sp. ATCC 55076]AQZ67451.1 RNA polymerase subunit sigma [Nonomuraea sp. ATCC 55076]SPL94296.1 RNA polymerase ECF-subfamily sigma factor [Actinomadura parvosata subsp. kistnae]